MGGKGGGGGDYYAQPPDTSGYGTLDEATQTLANTAPLDLSGYQQSIDVNKAANLATAPAAPTGGSTDGSGTGGSTDGSGSSLASSVLAPPSYWNSRQDLQPAPLTKSSAKTTQT